jgi:hypothetical protein
VNIPGAKPVEKPGDGLLKNLKPSDLRMPTLRNPRSVGQPDLPIAHPQQTWASPRELERALNNAQIMGQGVFQKYKKCLLKFPDMKINCDPNDKGCGHHGATTFGTLVISPLGSLGRKGKCGPVASTFLHELIHECYGDDLTGTMLTPLDQEREAFQSECQMFGYGCACAQDPKKCGY